MQATSTPGVSQRTGATTYYIEIAASGAGGAQALGLSPVPGRVDVLLCAELLEAARMLERGMCTPSRTTVIASTHRVYTTREKMSASDGRFDAQRIVGAIAALARRSVLFDMEEARARHRAAISAALFGALAGSGAAPLARTACEAAIRAAGKGVEASLAAFAEAYDRAATGESAAAQARTAVAAPSPDGAPPSELESRIAALPPGVAQFARPGAAQVAAYQDVPYASRYVDRVERIARAEASAAGAATACDVAREVARHLALWMCYDDVIRVATQKLRAARFARIRQETGARAGDVVRVYDYFKPGAAEIAAILPRGLGAWLERRALARASRAPAGRPVTLQTTSVAGLALLRAAAALRPLRPRSLRFAREQQEIGQWLAVVERALARRRRGMRSGAGAGAAAPAAQGLWRHLDRRPRTVRAHPRGATGLRSRAGPGRRAAPARRDAGGRRFRGLRTRRACARPSGRPTRPVGRPRRVRAIAPLTGERGISARGRRRRRARSSAAWSPA